MKPKHKTPVSSNHSPFPNQPRVAIVHDWLYGGGAELVVEQLHKLYPDAPIYTSYCTDEWRKRLNNKVVTGYLQHWPFAQLRKFLPVLRQHWFKNLDLSEFDLVISSTGNGEAKFVLPKQTPVTSNQSPIPKQPPGPIHICYCNTPTHFYWRKYSEYLKNPSFRPKWLVRLGLRILVKPLKKRDYKAAQSVDYFIANSSHIQKDIKKYYDRDSTVIHPPVNVKTFTKSKSQNTNNTSASLSPVTSNHSPIPNLITWGRHVPYKRIDLAIEVCNQLQIPLTVVGEGPETRTLKKLAGPTVAFAGYVSSEELLELAKKASAFIFPGEEDFGIAPVEAMALGLPVIAYQSGGALDYVKQSVTGEFFTEQTPESLVHILKNVDLQKYDSRIITEHAHEFSHEVFRKKMTDVIKHVMDRSN